MKIVVIEKALAFILLFLPCLSFGQKTALENYNIADSLLKANDLNGAYKVFKAIEPNCDTKDTIYDYIVWHYTNTLTQLEKEFRSSERFDSSLHFGLEALGLIQKGKSLFDDKFASREYWMIKNIIVSYFGLEKLDSANKYKKVLYDAYKSGALPKGIDEYFNFTFFKWEDKNIWGYEWYEEIPENRTKSSFSKIVYYVYNTNEDGTDKDQLYRLHVLMFHKYDNSTDFDYVLTKRQELEKEEVSRTLYSYTYKKDIDYKKLQKDIREVLKGNYNPRTKKYQK